MNGRAQVKWDKEELQKQCVKPLAIRTYEQRVDWFAAQTFSRHVRWESLRKNLFICTLLPRIETEQFGYSSLTLNKHNKVFQITWNQDQHRTTSVLQPRSSLTRVIDSIFGWSTALSLKSVPSLECLAKTGNQICTAALWGTVERERDSAQRKNWVLKWLTWSEVFWNASVFMCPCCWGGGVAYFVSLKAPGCLSPAGRSFGSGGSNWLGHMGSLSSRWKGLRHVKSNSGTIRTKSIRRLAQVDQL